MRRAGKVDDNQADVVALLRKLGCSVHITSSLGGGFPDVAVGLAGRTVLVEIKDGSKVPSKQKLTEQEAAFFDGWKGDAVVVNGEQDVFDLVNRLRLTGYSPL